MAAVDPMNCWGYNGISLAVEEEEEECSEPSIQRLLFIITISIRFVAQNGSRDWDGAPVDDDVSAEWQPAQKAVF